MRVNGILPILTTYQPLQDVRDLPQTTDDDDNYEVGASTGQSGRTRGAHVKSAVVSA